ncbi:MAG: FtsX-like permease family protein [Firmicutes bacterium]|nr:FtsX-like permease family protein [Bacillota bacterium]
MNIFNKVAFQGLKKNRTRTFVTIIGVVLSAAMITAVATFAVSLQNYMVNGAITRYGNWHVEFVNTTTDFAKKQSENDKVLNVTSFENIGYARLEGGKNLDKPYLFIAGFSQKAFDSLPVNLISGRLPENSSEVLVPVHVESNGGVKYSVGDTITLETGQRKAGNEILSQHDPFKSGEEKFIPTANKTYKVVGICQRPTFEERSAPGYTLITKSDSVDANNNISAFITLKKPSQTHSYLKNFTADNAYVLNDDVLRFLGFSNDKLFNTLLYSVGAILIALIMLGSVFLIYNSFTISLNDRMRQFGILMSVGATEKQLRNSVLFEGLCIGAVGIPIGMIISIPSIKLIISLVAKNFANIMYDNVQLTLKISVPSLIAAVIISMITILISAYIPAKKAAGVPVMECIRQTNEVKIDSKTIKTSKPIDNLYGLEATLALKNFRRNKRRYRSIIMSLIFSVALFVSSNSFGTALNQVADNTKAVTDYDIGFSVNDMSDGEMLNLFYKMKEAKDVTRSSYQIYMNYYGAVPLNKLSDDSITETNKYVSGETANLPMNIQFIDDETYLKFVRELGFPENEYTGQSGKLLGVAKMNDITGEADGPKDLKDIFTENSPEILITPRIENKQPTEPGKSINVTFAEFIPPDIPPIVTTSEDETNYYLTVLVPWSMKNSLMTPGSAEAVKVKGYTFESDNPTQTTQEMQEIINESGLTSGYTLLNSKKILEQNRNILFVINLFTIVFVIMISLISVANVFNTISTNIKLRRRELAMLRSVGMSDRNFNKMMRFECALYGLRTLLFGVPISLILSWLIFKGIDAGGGDIKFIFPWTSIAISILGVFLVIFITMLYATSRIRKENIIDALRDDMT